MNRLKKAWKQCNNNDGVAMVVALVVGVVIMVFCLSMLLVTYTLFAQTSRQTTQLQCKLLAQSYSEALDKEFSKKAEDSELQKYLADMIKDGSWMSEDDDSEEAGPGSYSEVTMEIDQSASNVAVGYTIVTTFTYENNDSEEDDEPLPGTDDDDQDDTGNDPETDPTNPDEPTQVGGSYIVHAVIQCMRGDGNGRDVQSYLLESQYVVSVSSDS